MRAVVRACKSQVACPAVAQDASSAARPPSAIHHLCISSPESSAHRPPSATCHSHKRCCVSYHMLHCSSAFCGHGQAVCSLCLHVVCSAHACAVRAAAEAQVRDKPQQFLNAVVAVVKSCCGQVLRGVHAHQMTCGAAPRSSECTCAQHSCTC